MKLISKLVSVNLLVLLICACKEKPAPPVITTTSVTEITTTTAVSGGEISDDGGATIISKGVCWNISDKPTNENNKSTESSTSASFSSNLSQLTPGTTYYVRAYATNSAGTGYGGSVLFKTLGDLPASSSSSASDINTNSATLNGLINSNSLSTSVTFEYGITTSYGSIIIAPQSPVSGEGNTSVNAFITGLAPGTTYHFRIIATNDLGTTNSNDMIFTTLGQSPIVLYEATANLQMRTITLNGSVNPNYLSTIVAFEWGPTTIYGNTITSLQSPLSGSTSINVNASLTGLNPGTTYHFRIKAINELGTTVGDDKSFTTLSPVTDIDGNVYDVVTIGDQVWMAENLKVTKYGNGDIIETTTPATLDVSGSDSTKYQWAYNGDESNVAAFGRLYTWYAATDNRDICPVGWHVPARTEWQVLYFYLRNNGYGYNGDINLNAKPLASKTGWHEDIQSGVPGNNQSENNSSGFTGYPAGIRLKDGLFASASYLAVWWGSTNVRAGYNYYFGLAYNAGWQQEFSREGELDVFPVIEGASIRCVKN
jgi:uncharacterized protein (TIGR02145 family)